MWLVTDVADGRGRDDGHVPVGAPESVARVGREADEVVCVTLPPKLRAVGRWYRDFSPVSDAEVIAALAAASPQPATASRPGPAPGDRPGDVKG